MASSFSSRRRRVTARGPLCLLLCLPPWGAAELFAASPPALAAPVVGLLAAAEPEITASLAAGARLALATAESTAGVRLRLTVAEAAHGWSAASGPAVELAFDQRVIAIVSPPDRRTAHLLAQLGTRAQVPIVSTSESLSVTATGSFWVVSVGEREAAAAGPTEAFRQRFLEAEGRDPDRWAVLGYDAAVAVVAAVARAGLDRRGVVEAWRGGVTAAATPGVPRP